MNARNPDEYRHLQQQIAEVLSPVVGTSGRYAEQDKARTYWVVGRMLNEHVGGRAAYGEQVVKRLAGDLGLDKGVVYRMMRFNRRLPNVASWPLLPWSHCRLLIAVPDQERMEALLEAAVREKWSVRQLQARIREVRPATRQEGHTGEAAVAPVAPPIPRRGCLHTYRLVASGSDVALDLGFGVRQRVAALSLKAKQEKKVQAIFAAGGAVEATANKAGRAKIRKAALGRERLYAYEVVFRRMAEADSALVEADLGFGIHLVQRLRLRGVDVGDLSAARARAVQELAGRRLSGAGVVVAKTFRPDPRGQYLADFYYLDGEADPRRVAEEGRYLNGELLDSELPGRAAPDLIDPQPAT